MENNRETRKKNKLQLFFSRLAEKIDKKMEEKAKENPCCCNRDKSKDNQCCK